MHPVGIMASNNARGQSKTKIATSAVIAHAKIAKRVARKEICVKRRMGFSSLGWLARGASVVRGIGYFSFAIALDGTDKTDCQYDSSRWHPLGGGAALLERPEGHCVIG